MQLPRGYVSKLSSVDVPHRDKTLPKRFLKQLRWNEWRIAATFVHHTESYKNQDNCEFTYALRCKTSNLDHEPTRLYLPRVKLVNDALEANNCEKSRAESCQPGQKENSERQQRLPSRRLRQSTGQASAATSSRGVGPPVARHRTPGVGARFVLTIGGGVVLRHVLSEPCWRIWLGKLFPPPRTPLCPPTHSLLGANISAARLQLQLFACFIITTCIYLQ